MATKAQEEALNLYASLMEETKIRIDAVNFGTSNRLPIVPALVKEFCFLQIRLVCECIALGCLVAHGDLDLSSRLKKEWAADKIMGELENLHPDFFPQATRQSRTPEGIHNLERDHTQLTKEEFLRIYNDCGSVLHKGGLKKPLKQRMPIQVNYPEITSKLQSIVNLLNVHVLSAKSGDMFYLCILRNKDNNMLCQVAICERPSQTRS